MSKVVVTGAAGFIGSNLVRALLKRRRAVRGVDGLQRGSKGNLECLGIEVIRADLREFSQALRALEGAQVVYHLAARVGSIDYLHGSNAAELETLRSNLAIDANVFRACSELGVRKIVYASSVSVYPIDRQQQLGARFEEDDIYPINPEGGYGWAKLIGEKQLALMEGIKSGIARIFNAYGPFSEFGKSGQVVPALIRKAVNYPREKFVIWGDGTQTRNLLFIDDCVDALLRIEERASFPPLTLNIGNPETITIKQLAQIVIDASGKKIPIRFDESRPVGPLSRIPEISRAANVIGWRPTTPLFTGIAKTYQWIQQKMKAS